MKNHTIFSKYVFFVGPAVLVSIGYMDPGNWATAIEGGSRFGYELIWTVVLSNFIAVFLQSLAARLGLVTGKHLAQVCQDEYPRAVCVSLWMLCEASLVALDMAMILGTAIGLNLLVGLHILACVILVAMDALFLMFILPFLGVRKAELIPVSVVGVVLLSVVLSAIFSKPSSSAVITGLIPQLRRDNLYTTVSLLGANIAPHNLYLHSALVLVQRKASTLSIEEYCKHNLVDVSFVLGAAILVNLAVLLVAASSFHNAGLAILTLQDAYVLTQHVLSDLVSPLAFGLALLCAGQLSTLTGTIIGQVVIEGFFGTNVDAWLHRLIIRAVAILPAFLCAWRYGNEGIYQILIFSQIVLALQLPFMAIPLIKATSSQACMGSYKSTALVEVVAWIIVAVIFILNLSLVLNVLLSETDEWIGSTSWEYAGGLSWAHAKFGEPVSTLIAASMLVVVGLSVGFFIWLILTPIKANSHETQDSMCIENHLDMITDKGVEKAEIMHAVSELKPGPQGVSDRKDDLSMSPQGVMPLEIEGSVAEETAKVFYNGCDQKDGFGSVNSQKSQSDVKQKVFESISMPETSCSEMVKKHLLELCKVREPPANIPNVKPFQKPQQAVSQPKLSQFEPSQLESCHKDILVTASVPSRSIVPLGPALSLGSTLEQSSVAILSSRGKTILDDLDSPALKRAEAEADADLIEKEEDDVDGWEYPEHEEVVADALSELGGSLHSVAYDETKSGRSIGAKSDTSEGGGGGSGSGSLSRLSGLGRAARRHFASILDEFWGKLFDLHGQALLQSRTRSQGLAINTKNAQNGRVQSATFQEGSEKNGHNGLVRQGWRAGYKHSFISQPPACSHASASASDRLPYGLSQDAYVDGAPTSFVDDRSYSSLRFPTYHEEVDYQLPTIHGYGAALNRRTSTLVGSPKARSLHFGMQSQISNYGSTSPREPNTEPSLGHLFWRPEIVPSVLQNLNNRLQVDHVPFDSPQSYVATHHTNDSFVNSSVMDTHVGEQSISYKKSRLPQADASFYDASEKDPFALRTTEKWNPLVYRATGELDIGLAKLQTTFQANKKLGSFSRSPIGRGGNAEYPALHAERTPLAFDQIAPSQMHLEGFSLRTPSKYDNPSLWSRQPFEQLFGTSDLTHGKGLHISGDSDVVRRPEDRVFSLSNGVKFGIEVLECLQVCIARLLQLEGSDWLFRVDNGSDEDLIAAIAAHEKFLLDSDSHNSSRAYRIDDQFSHVCNESHFRIGDTGSLRQVPYCGDGCIWGTPVLISFGVWSIHRVLELSLMESRPELWGKYTYVLNHLQGILEPAFARPRTVPFPCLCIQSYASHEDYQRSKRCILKDYFTGDFLCLPSNGSSSQSYPYPWSWGRNTTIPNGKAANSVLFVDMIKEVEAAVGSKKGRTGTAAGDVAFPKGKENLASVLKRFKRRLGNKPGKTSCSGGGIGKDIGIAPAAFLHLLHIL